MNKTLAWIVLSAALYCVLLPGCGGNATDTNTNVNNHVVTQLVSVGVFPQTADAQNFSGGVVEFAFNQGFTPDPSGVAAGTQIRSVATWCVAKNANTCAGIDDVTGAVVYGEDTGTGVANGTGDHALAHCSPGFTGQAMILAGSQFANPDSASFRVANPPPFVVGSFATATLSCP